MRRRDWAALVAYVCLAYVCLLLIVAFSFRWMQGCRVLSYWDCL